MDFAAQVTEFRRTLHAALPRLRAIDEARAGAAREPGKWTPKQILGHLVDSAANNHARFVEAQLRDDLVFAGYDQDEWVHVQRYDARPWRELIDLWFAYNLHLAHVMEHTDTASRTLPRRRHSLGEIALRAHDAETPGTLGWLMADYVLHLRHHLEQVFAT